MVPQRRLVAVLEDPLAVEVQKLPVHRGAVGGVVVYDHPAAVLDGQIAVLIAHPEILGEKFPASRRAAQQERQALLPRLKGEGQRPIPDGRQGQPASDRGLRRAGAAAQQTVPRDGVLAVLVVRFDARHGRGGIGDAGLDAFQDGTPGA